MLLRDAIPTDFAPILRLNEESVHFLSPLTLERLERLHHQAAYHRVIEIAGEVAAVLLAFREGSTYDSLNYQWFSEHFDRFLYIDRVIVALNQQGRGLGPRLYADVFSFAARHAVSQVTCEFDIDPPNEISRRFHGRHGFREVGTLNVAAGKKRASLQAAQVPALPVA